MPIVILTPQERLGTKLGGKYKIEEILGQGGMGVVFGGTHTWTGRKVAIKVLHAQYMQEPQIVQRFLREARATTAIDSVNVVEVLDMGEDEHGIAYLVLERLYGESLKDRIKKGNLSAEAAWLCLSPLMEALGKAHDQGIVHRDIKPDNIFLAERDGVSVPKLLDFGIAKLLEGTHAGGTSTGAIIGTPWFMSPEQARGLSAVGPPSDVWSMAVVFYVAVSGKLPFVAGSSTAALAALVGAAEMRPLKEAFPDLPSAVCEIIDSALQRDPSSRPTARELATRLGEALTRERASLPPARPGVADVSGRHLLHGMDSAVSEPMEAGASGGVEADSLLDFANTGGASASGPGLGSAPSGSFSIAEMVSMEEEAKASSEPMAKAPAAAPPIEEAAPAPSAPEPAGKSARVYQVALIGLVILLALGIGWFASAREEGPSEPPAESATPEQAQAGEGGEAPEEPPEEGEAQAALPAAEGTVGGGAAATNEPSPSRPSPGGAGEPQESEAHPEHHAEQAPPAGAHHRHHRGHASDVEAGSGSTSSPASPSQPSGPRAGANNAFILDSR